MEAFSTSPMPRLHPLSTSARAAAFALLALAAGDCSAPEDRSQEYFVRPDQVYTLIYRGTSAYTSATLFHVIGSDTVVVPNAVFTWTGGGDHMQIIPHPEDSYVQLVGVASGTDCYFVEAPAYGTETGSYNCIRVADQVELDTVLQDTVALGGRLTLRGVRVGDPNDISVRLNGVTLIPDTLSLIGNTDSVQQMSYFVPGNATSGVLQLIGFGLIAQDSDTVVVLPQEVFEPNELTPTVVGLDTAQPYPAATDPDSDYAGHPEVHFFDPALLYELPTAGDTITADWFHFVSALNTGQPWTFVYRSPAIPRRGAFGVPATQVGGVPVFAAGAYGFDFLSHSLLSRCRGGDLEFPVPGAVDSIVLSVQSLPGSGIDFAEYTANAGAYALGVYAGFRSPDNPVSSNPIAPDKYEDNDFCEQADANFAIDTLKVDLGVADMKDTLTIDTPFEVDWIRFHVASGGNVTMRTAPRSGFPDAALDLYLFKQADLSPVDAATGNPNADETISGSLNAGDYYLVVVNTDGQPTKYGLCIAAGGSCNELPEPSRGVAGSRRR